MLVAHWMYLAAAMLEMFDKQSTKDTDIDFSENDVNVHTRGNEAILKKLREEQADNVTEYSSMSMDLSNHFASERTYITLRRMSSVGLRKTVATRDSYVVASW